MAKKYVVKYKLHMSKDRLQRLFNLAAPVFSLLDAFSVANHNREKAFAYIKEMVDLSGKKVLDIGCGTGIWSNLFKESGAIVHGIDFAPQMIRIAAKKYDGILFSVAEANTVRDYPDNYFDIVTLSFVLHDVVERLALLKEINRISKLLIVFDYGGRPPLIPAIFEFFEGGRYRCFLRDFYDELESTFSKNEIIKLENGGALYISS